MSEITGDLPSKTENSIVSFPKEQIFSGEGTLEAYFRNLAQTDTEDVIAYNKSPKEFSSIGTDYYLNWLAELTSKDPKHRERGAWIHIKTDGKIIYPSNPTIGRFNHVSNNVYSRSNKFAPFMRSHSHPGGTCFSPQDLKRELSDELFIAEALGSRKRNFLLLRTDQTTFDDPQEVSDKMDNITRDTEKISLEQLITVYNQMIKGGIPKKVADNTLRRISQADLDELGTDYGSYYLTIAATHFAAKEYNLGFYISNKDGIYSRFKPEDLAQISRIKRDLIKRTLDSTASD